MKAALIILLAIALAIVGLSLYLSPDDIARCNQSQSPSTAQDCRPADAIVAISGGDTAARTKEAIDLYKNGWAPVLIFSGAALDKSGPSNAEAMRRTAIQSGVPAGDIIIEEQGETTTGNAEKTQTIFQENNVSSVILVTSAYHQRRAGLEFSKRSEGVDVRNHPVASDSQWSAWWWLTPTGWYLATSEFVKIIAFYVGIGGIR